MRGVVCFLVLCIASATAVAQPPSAEEIKAIDERVAFWRTTCLGDCDAATHMTRAQWRTTCERVAVERRQFLLQDPALSRSARAVSVDRAEHPSCSPNLRSASRPSRTRGSGLGLLHRLPPIRQASSVQEFPWRSSFVECCARFHANRLRVAATDSESTYIVRVRGANRVLKVELAYVCMDDRETLVDQQ
jgi:hypothetical protein